MSTVSDAVLAHLQPLIGLKLAIARRAADMRGFHFGEVRPHREGTVGEYALHIQCAWRIDGQEGIVTGRSDLWEPAEVDARVDWDHWDYEKDGNLQDKLIGALLGGYDPKTRSFVNETSLLVVEAVEADAFGGATILLSGGYRLLLFPAGCNGEDWRVFRNRPDEPHFVVSGGRVETTE